MTGAKALPANDGPRPALARDVGKLKTSDSMGYSVRLDASF
jgi:hypothetical protein